MYLFAKKFSFFALGFILLIFLIYIFNIVSIKHSNLDFSNVNILIIGDSHSQTSLNPEYFNNSINVSVGAESYFVTYFKLKMILEKSKVDTILLSFSPHNFSSFNDNKFFDDPWAKRYANTYYPLIRMGILKDIDANMSYFYNIYFQKMFLFPKIDHHDKIIGNFSKKTSVNLEETQIQRTINKHYYRNEMLLNTSKIQSAYLDSIIGICKKKNVELFLISTPLYNKYLDNIPKLFYNEFLKQKMRMISLNQVVLDHTNEFINDSLFYDSDHINYQGSITFSKIINKSIKD